MWLGWGRLAPLPYIYIIGLWRPFLQGQTA